MTKYAIFKATGVDQATLSRFLSRQGGMSLPTVDTLVRFLELELRPWKGR